MSRLAGPTQAAGLAIGHVVAALPWVISVLWPLFARIPDVLILAGEILGSVVFLFQSSFYFSLAYLSSAVTFRSKEQELIIAELNGDKDIIPLSS
jgi:hypothetical protein